MQNKAPIFKGRPSALGQIMTNGRGKSNETLFQEGLAKIKENRAKLVGLDKTKATYKNGVKKIKSDLAKLRLIDRNKPNLSQTCISYLEKWMKEKLYDRKIEFSNKYVEKGLQMEDDSIAYISKYFNWSNVVKNTVRKSNEWIDGECDISIGKDFGADVKNSYSMDTFPLFDEKIPTDGYEWQLYGYADLYGFKRLRLVYVLMDLPEESVDKEAYYEMKKRGLDEIDEDLWNEVKAKHTYSHLPDELRIKYFDFPRCDDSINAIHVRVEECRYYIENYTNFLELWSKVHS